MLYQLWIWWLYILQKQCLWFASVPPVHKCHFISYYEITCAHLLICLGVCSLPSLLQHSCPLNRGVTVLHNYPNCWNDNYSYTVLLLFCFLEDFITLAGFSQGLSSRNIVGIDLEFWMIDFVIIYMEEWCICYSYTLFIGAVFQNQRKYLWENDA